MSEPAPHHGFASPPSRIVIGCDGSPGGADAVALAARLGGEGAHYLLVDVAPRGALARRVGEHRPADFSAARHALAAVPRATIETRTIRADRPAQALGDVAADERHDLVVVGSPHRGTIGRALFGSVARELVYRAAVPLAVAPHGFATRRRPAHRAAYAVGVDGTGESLAALAWAEALAAGRDAELEIERDAPNLAAAAAKADLLVVGTQVHRPFEPALLGSVTEDLVTAPECPIVALPVRSRPPHDQRSNHDGAVAAGPKDMPA